MKFKTVNKCIKTIIKIIKREFENILDDDSVYVFYDDEYGFCIRTEDVMDNLDDICEKTLKIIQDND